MHASYKSSEDNATEEVDLDQVIRSQRHHRCWDEDLLVYFVTM